jgi:glucose-1-phosphate thymidylyltransferase
MEIAKALVLIGSGGDDRPWPTAPTSPKHLFPVANRPILSHNLESLRAAGVLEAGVLAPKETAPAIRRAIGSGRDCGLNLQYLPWEDGDSVTSALAAGFEFLNGEPALVQQGDALLRGRMHSHIAAFAREGLDALSLQLEDEPAMRPLEHAGDPGYLLSARAISILLDGHRRGADPLAAVRAGGGRVRVERVAGCLPCHGDQQRLLEGNQHMLEGLQGSYVADSVVDSRLQGPVVVHPSARVRGSLIRGPAIIGPESVVTDAYIGPYTSIGPGVFIEGSEIEYSIVLAGAQLQFVGTRLESSIIGRGARIARAFDPPATMRMTLGDGVEVILK